MPLPISHRSDLLPAMQDVMNPCDRWNPFFEKMTPRMYQAILMMRNSANISAQILKKEYGITNMDFIEQCGLEEKALTLFNAGASRWDQIKQGYALITPKTLLFFDSRESRQVAQEQLQSGGVFDGEGSFLGSSDNQIMHDGKYAYYKNWEDNGIKVIVMDDPMTRKKDA